MAVKALEEDIVLGKLHPRERLVEDELCARFGLKRHVARLVLTELELQGLIERRKNIGALVMSYSAQEVIDLYALREILETNAARLIAMPVPQSKLAALVKIQDLHDAAVQRADLRAVFRANVEFHTALFGLADNSVLNEAIKEYERRTHAIRFSSIIFPNYLDNVRREHHAMIEALQSSDKKQLVALCRDHLRPARDAYLKTYHPQLELTRLPDRSKADAL
jgi:DNA-binding GntR family transcriptional regulator